MHLVKYPLQKMDMRRKCVPVAPMCKMCANFAEVLHVCSLLASERDTIMGNKWKLDIYGTW